MIIINQDKDLIIITPEKIYCKKHYATIHDKRLFMGYNIYADRELLGTFDTKETCNTVIAEIKQHERGGMLSYTVPEEADDLEELEAAK